MFINKITRKEGAEDFILYLRDHQSLPNFHYVVVPHKVSVTGNREPDTMETPI
jgi:hypothetical protein